MKQKFKDLLLQLEEEYSKPVKDTIEFLITCSVVIVIRLILTGRYYVEFCDVPNFLFTILLSFLLNYSVNEFEDSDGSHSLKTIVMKILRYETHILVLYMLIMK